MDGDSHDISDALKSWDAGLVVGAGVHAGGISGEVRWTEGLVDLGKDGAFGTKTRNRTISFLVGYRF